METSRQLFQAVDLIPVFYSSFSGGHVLSSRTLGFPINRRPIAEFLVLIKG
jgi:hypothetical protein